MKFIFIDRSFKWYTYHLHPLFLWAQFHDASYLNPFLYLHTFLQFILDAADLLISCRLYDSTRPLSCPHNRPLTIASLPYNRIHVILLRCLSIFSPGICIALSWTYIKSGDIEFNGASLVTTSLRGFNIKPRTSLRTRLRSWLKFN